MVQSIKDLAEELVGKECVDAFGLWAFGEDYSEIETGKYFAKAWNKRHADLFKIDFDSSIVADMILMTDLWRDREHY